MDDVLVGAADQLVALDALDAQEISPRRVGERDPPLTARYPDRLGRASDDLLPASARLDELSAQLLDAIHEPKLLGDVWAGAIHVRVVLAADFGVGLGRLLQVDGDVAAGVAERDRGTRDSTTFPADEGVSDLEARRRHAERDLENRAG